MLREVDLQKIAANVKAEGWTAAEKEARAVLSSHQQEIDAALALRVRTREKQFSDDYAERLNSDLDAFEKSTAEQICQADAACRARVEKERRDAELKRLEQQREAALKSVQDAEDRRRAADLEQQKRQAEAHAKKEAEFKTIAENLARLGFKLEQFVRFSSTNKQVQGSAPSPEDCALQCLKISWCSGFAYRGGQCFQVADSLRQYDDIAGEWISGRKVNGLDGPTTSGGNMPSAKMTVWNEAMYYFHVAPAFYRKILFVLKHSRREQSFASYYLKTHGYLVPDGVELWEFNLGAGSGERLR